MSTVFGNVNSVLALAALLSVQSPLTQQSYRDSQAQELRKPLESSHGDPISLLNFYKEWLTIKQYSAPVQGCSRDKSENSRVWSRKRCLEEQRFYEVTKLLEQFRDILEEANLISKGPEQDLSSAERMIRHGELKKLKLMRYELKRDGKNKQRKLLKYEIYNSGEDDTSFNDIRDVEFRMSNDFKRLQRLLSETSTDSYKDLMMLKLILTSGLYPQIAVGDEFNSSKTVSERLYHTKHKNYVFLRPMSYFAINSSILELHSDDIEVPPPGYFSKSPISSKHQVLVYQTILETKKVYLVNTMRMPAVQTLMLFAKTIATNRTFTKYVFDEFLMSDVPHFGSGHTLLTQAIQLRRKWKEKLDYKLENLESNHETDEREIFHFIEDLVQYMNKAVSYNIKRLLPADLKDIYTHESYSDIGNLALNPLDQTFKASPNLKLGGINLSENVVYDCLLQEEWELEIEQQIYTTPFECTSCNSSTLGLSVIQLMQHKISCKDKNGDMETEQQKNVDNTVKPNSQKYHCSKCNRNLYLTPVDILKHKKTCPNAGSGDKF